MSRSSFLRRGSGNHDTPSHRRAKKQEAELARRFGGTLVPGSGAGRNQKGDVKKCANGTVRIEAKTTKNKSFSITREMARKIQDASLTHNELPAIIVEFVDELGRPEMELAVVPTYAIQLLGEIRDQSEHSE